MFFWSLKDKFSKNWLDYLTFTGQAPSLSLLSFPLFLITLVACCCWTSSCCQDSPEGWTVLSPPPQRWLSSGWTGTALGTRRCGSGWAVDGWGTTCVTSSWWWALACWEQGCGDLWLDSTERANHKTCRKYKGFFCQSWTRVLSCIDVHLARH